MSTESDRELLELAAKANGLPWKWVKCPAYKIEVPGLLYRDEAHEVDYYPGWNPLENDGDALRLFTRLPFRTLYVSEVGVTVSWEREDGSGHGFKCDEYASEHQGNMNAATRRAIVRAAAAIGRAIP